MLICGVRSPIGLAVAGLAGTLLASTFLAIAADANVLITLRRDVVPSRRSVMSTLSAIAWHRRSYAALLIHLGFGCMAIGIAGSSLGSHETDLSMTRGQTVEFEGRTIHYTDLLQDRSPPEGRRRRPT